MKKYDQAVNDCDQALKLEPGNAKGYYIRAVARGRQKQFPHALVDVEKAIDLDPKFAEAYNIPGYILSTGMQQHQRALEDLNRAIEMRPDNIDAYLNRAQALGELDQVEAAILDYFQVVQRAPELEATYYQRGMLYYKRKQWDRAGMDFSHY